jgi:lipopolysaccharide/colanic/teichoic acid biosynthesis glycosyltransferase
MWWAASRSLSPDSDVDRPVQLPLAAGIAPSRSRRALDIAVALLVLGISVPLLLTLVVAVRLSTGGSAVFRQRRVGQGGAPFTLYKFRTMRPGLGGPEVTAPGDLRVTRLGGVLRRTSVDELPQMVNVLLGHMTLVGPRPESVALARRYPAAFQSVFCYRPGVTGPSQVLVRDEKVLGHVIDVERYYLSELVPRRVATDMMFLETASLSSTVRWLALTARYLVGVVGPRSASRAAVEVQPLTRD